MRLHVYTHARVYVGLPYTTRVVSVLRLCRRAVFLYSASPNPRETARSPFTWGVAASGSTRTSQSASASGSGTLRSRASGPDVTQCVMWLDAPVIWLPLISDSTWYGASYSIRWHTRVGDTDERTGKSERDRDTQYTRGRERERERDFDEEIS